MPVTYDTVSLYPSDNDIFVRSNYKTLMEEFYLYCFNNQYKYDHFRPADLVPDVDFDDEGHPFMSPIVVFYEYE